MRRIKREQYFMAIAELTAERSTCDRAKVGAIAIKDKRIIMSGYNGSPAGLKHCEDKHYLINDHCEWTVHAEQNVIAQAAKHGISLNDTTLYVTHEPCFNCLKLLISSGIKKVIYKYKRKDIRTPAIYYDMIEVKQYVKQIFE